MNLKMYMAPMTTLLWIRFHNLEISLSTLQLNPRINLEKRHSLQQVQLHILARPVPKITRTFIHYSNKQNEAETRKCNACYIKLVNSFSVN